MAKGKPDAYTPYAAGRKRYGSGLMDAPNVGKVDRLGYKERDAKTRFRRNALLRRAKAGQQGKHMSAAWQGFSFGRNI